MYVDKCLIMYIKCIRLRWYLWTCRDATCNHWMIGRAWRLNKERKFLAGTVHRIWPCIRPVVGQISSRISRGFGKILGCSLPRIRPAIRPDCDVTAFRLHFHFHFRFCWGVWSKYHVTMWFRNHVCNLVVSDCLFSCGSNVHYVGFCVIWLRSPGER